MISDDDILEQLAQDGSMDYSHWPGLLERILPRLDQIVYNDFPIPKQSPPPPPPPPPPRSLLPSPFKQENLPSRSTPSPVSHKENALSSSPLERQATPKPRSPSPPPPLSFRPISEFNITEPPSTFPPQLLSLTSSIKTVLKAQFANVPPYTIQRLAELILRPTLHYRTLPSYLRALDRIVSVCTPANMFPLSDHMSYATPNGRILNGTLTPDPPATHNAYDFFGGAELTPIPWLNNGAKSPSYPNTEHVTASDLRTESTSLIDGPNGAGSVETVTVNGIGRVAHEGLSRRDEDMGSMPITSQAVYGDRVLRSNADRPKAKDEGVEEAEEEKLTARGPEEIGITDTGPQSPRSGGFDIEAAVGRKGEGENMVDSGSKPEKESQDGDGDYVIVDAEEAVAAADEKVL